jgi:hypothetical protein
MKDANENDDVPKRRRVPGARLRAIAARFNRNALAAAARATKLRVVVPPDEFQVQQILVRDGERGLVAWHGFQDPSWQPLADIPLFFRELYEEQGNVTVLEYCSLLDRGYKCS